MSPPPYERTLRQREFIAVRDAARQQGVRVRFLQDTVTYRLTFVPPVSSFAGPAEHLQRFRISALEGVIAVSYGDDTVHVVTPYGEPYEDHATQRLVEIPTVTPYMITAITENAKALLSVGVFNNLQRLYFQLVDSGLVNPRKHISW